MQLSEPLEKSQNYFHTPTPIARKTFLYPLCLGHYWCDQNYHVSRNSYDSYLLMLIKTGSGYAGTDQEQVSLSPGQAMLLNCYQPHSYGTFSHMEFYWIHFDGPQASEYFRYLLNCQKFPLSLCPADYLQLENLFQMMIHGFSETSLAEIQYGKYITDMLTSLAVSTESGNIINSQAKDYNAMSSFLACQKAMNYMQQQFHTPLTIEDIASHVSLSPYYLIRCFKKQYGITPHQYLTNLRLNSACFYLRSTAKTIGEIAFLCGFQSENNFCIAFKKQAGMTPTCYREST